MKTALIPNVQIAAAAYYDLIAPPLVSTCPRDCPCPRHWPPADPWPGAPLVPPLPRRIRGAR